MPVKGLISLVDQTVPVTAHRQRAFPVPNTFSERSLFVKWRVRKALPVVADPLPS
jgi:hypothetical protein